MFKKISIVFLTVFFMLSLASCGLSEKSSEDIADKLVEGIMDKAAGDDADIDYKDGKVTVKGKDGEEVTVGETKGLRSWLQPVKFLNSKPAISYLLWLLKILSWSPLKESS